MQPGLSARFIVTHLLLPLAMFGLLAVGLELSAVDVTVADHIYAWGGNAWMLRDAWITSTFIHNDGRKLVTVLSVVLLLLLIASHFVPKLKPWRKGLWYLAASAVGAGLAINVLKHLTHVDCPWDLLRYGGQFPYLKKFATHPEGLLTGACFPAGHASAGYAWLGLYYFARDLYPRWRLWALAAVILLGVVFGIGQQLRGAHFLSHDLWTLGLCWLCATLVYMAFGRLAAARVSPDLH